MNTGLVAETVLPGRPVLLRLGASGPSGGAGVPGTITGTHLLNERSFFITY